MSETQLPTVYPCFYDEVTGELLACASKTNPSQRCPVGYDRVGNTTNCRKQIATTETQTTQSAVSIIVATPRTGGEDFKFSPEVILVISVIILAIGIYTFFANPKKNND